MTDTPDPRIEVVAKLLFTGPLEQMHPDQWEHAKAERWGPAVSCLMAAEDVLRGIDAATEWEYGWLSPEHVRDVPIRADSEATARECARIVGGTAMRSRPFGWEPLP